MDRSRINGSATRDDEDWDGYDAASERGRVGEVDGELTTDNECGMLNDLTDAHGEEEDDDDDGSRCVQAGCGLVEEFSEDEEGDMYSPREDRSLGVAGEGSSDMSIGRVSDVPIDGIDGDAILNGVHSSRLSIQCHMQPTDHLSRANGSGSSSSSAHIAVNNSSCNSGGLRTTNATIAVSCSNSSNISTRPLLDDQISLLSYSPPDRDRDDNHHLLEQIIVGGSAHTGSAHTGSGVGSGVYIGNGAYSIKEHRQRKSHGAGQGHIRAREGQGGSSSNSNSNSNSNRSIGSGSGGGGHISRPVGKAYSSAKGGSSDGHCTSTCTALSSSGSGSRSGRKEGGEAGGLDSTSKSYQEPPLTQWRGNRSSYDSKNSQSPTRSHPNDTRERNDHNSGNNGDGGFHSGNGGNGNGNGNGKIHRSNSHGHGGERGEKKSTRANGKKALS